MFNLHLLISFLLLLVSSHVYAIDDEFENWMKSQVGVWASFNSCPLETGKAKLRENDACASEGGNFHSKRGSNRIHSAVDLESTVQSGAKVFAVGAGKVGLVGNWPNMGKIIIVDHGDGVYSLYSHLNTIEVVKDKKLNGGEAIGTIGYSGNAQCLRNKGLPPHVHFAVFKSGFSGEAMLAQRIHLWNEYGRMKQHFNISGFGPLDPTNWLNQKQCF